MGSAWSLVNGKQTELKLERSGPPVWLKIAASRCRRTLGECAETDLDNSHNPSPKRSTRLHWRLPYVDQLQKWGFY